MILEPTEKRHKDKHNILYQTHSNGQTSPVDAFTSMPQVEKKDTVMISSTAAS